MGSRPGMRPKICSHSLGSITPGRAAARQGAIPPRAHLEEDSAQEKTPGGKVASGGLRLSARKGGRTVDSCLLRVRPALGQSAEAAGLAVDDPGAGPAQVEQVRIGGG